MQTEVQVLREKINRYRLSKDSLDIQLISLDRQNKEEKMALIEELKLCDEKLNKQKRAIDDLVNRKQHLETTNDELERNFVDNETDQDVRKSRT